MVRPSLAWLDLAEAMGLLSTPGALPDSGDEASDAAQSEAAEEEREVAAKAEAERDAAAKAEAALQAMELAQAAQKASAERDENTRIAAERAGAERRAEEAKQAVCVVAAASKMDDAVAATAHPV